MAIWADCSCGRIGHLGRLATWADWPSRPRSAESCTGERVILTSQMSVCVQSCPFASDRAPRVASDAIKRVTFATEDATFATVLRSRRARVTSGTIKRDTFAKGDTTFATVLRELESCPAEVASKTSLEGNHSATARKRGRFEIKMALPLGIWRGRCRDPR